MMTVAKDIEEALVKWAALEQQVKDAEEKLSATMKELAQASQSIGHKLVPVDATEGEKFHFWLGDGLIEITSSRQPYDTKFAVVWRTEMSPKSRAELNIH